MGLDYMTSKSIIAPDSPVIVPASYVGTSCRFTTTAPPINYSLARSWDYQGSRDLTTTRAVMCRINPSAGVYDWQTFDELLAANPGKQLIICLGQPGDYLVTPAAIGGAYCGGKANMCPTDLVGWATAVTAVVNRAKAAGRSGLWWELWNEIDQAPSYADSVSLLGPYTKATAQAIKAADPTALVLGPSLAGNDAAKLAFAVTYINASDGAGGTSAQWLDGICTHYYNQVTGQISQFENPLNYIQHYRNFQGAMAAAGCRLPIYVTETGVLAADTNGARAYQRRMLTFAALGAKCFLGYQYDGSGYPISGYQSQWNIAAALLAPGNAITSMVPGMAQMQITVNGVTYTF